MANRKYRNNGRHGKFGKDIETVVISRRVPISHISEVTEKFDKIIMEVRSKMAMNELIGLIRNLWPNSELYCSEREGLDPILDACMVIPGGVDRLIYLSEGLMTGKSIQPLLLKNLEDFGKVKNKWRDRVELNDLMDTVVYGIKYKIIDGYYCLIPGKDFKLIEDALKNEIESWFEIEFNKLSANETEVEL